MHACPSQWTKYSVYLNSEMDRNNIHKFPTLDLNLFAAFNLNSAINIFVANVQLSMNQQGGCCDNGRPYHDIIREHLAHAGTGQWQQNFESVRVTCKKCLNSTMIRTFQYESLILVFFCFKSLQRSPWVCLCWENYEASIMKCPCFWNMTETFVGWHCRRFTDCFSDK